MQRLFNEFRKHNHTIKTLGFLSLTLILFMSCIVHEFERKDQPELFGTVLNSAWNSFVSVTTIGYGDMYPKTPGGKFAAVV
jgi:voltage-gated potassium channel